MAVHALGKRKAAPILHLQGFIVRLVRDHFDGEMQRCIDEPGGMLSMVEHIMQMEVGALFKE